MKISLRVGSLVESVAIEFTEVERRAPVEVNAVTIDDASCEWVSSQWPAAVPPSAVS